MKSKGLNLKQKGFYEILSSRTNLTKLVVTIWSICCMYMKIINGLRHTEAKNFLTRFFFKQTTHCKGSQLLTFKERLPYLQISIKNLDTNSRRFSSNGKGPSALLEICAASTCQ
jgi:hypothetical protein